MICPKCDCELCNENTERKAKGRRFQQWVRDKLIEVLNIHPEDIESRSMGAGGEDLIMARVRTRNISIFDRM